MSLSIPMWVIYVVGGIVGLAVLGFAVLGVVGFIAFRNWRPF